MNWKACLVIVSAPVLLGNAKEEKAVFKRFLTAAYVGSYLKDDFIDLPTAEELAFLQSLNGCKNTTLEAVGGREKPGFGLQWSCREKPKVRAAVIYLQNGKIDRILPSTVSMGRF